MLVESVGSRSSRSSRSKSKSVVVTTTAPALVVRRRQPHNTRSPPTATTTIDNLACQATTTTTTLEPIQLRAGGGEEVTTTARSASRLKVSFYFGLWYALNVIFNIVNKKLLNVVAAPLTIGCLQLFVGSTFSLILWGSGLRTPPTLTKPYGLRRILRVGLSHSSGQLLSQVSLGAGPVSFTHIVKALEPLFSAVVSALLLGKWMSWPVYASLLPVVGGVGYACMKERYFSWLAFNTAMGSNLAFAFRAADSKRVLSDQGNIGTNLTSANTFGLVTICAAFLSLPVVFIDGNALAAAWRSSSGDAMATAITTHRSLVQAIVVSGMFHYLNNEVMYLALSNVHPVTLAVGNTMKRVFIMVASVMVFRNPISPQAGIGSAIGIAGVLLYSLAKQRFENEAAVLVAAVK